MVPGGSDHLVQYPGLPCGEVDPVAWETALQKRIKDELYVSSKLEVALLFQMLKLSL